MICYLLSKKGILGLTLSHFQINYTVAIIARDLQDESKIGSLLTNKMHLQTHSKGQSQLSCHSWHTFPFS